MRLKQLVYKNIKLIFLYSKKPIKMYSISLKRFFYYVAIDIMNTFCE